MENENTQLTAESISDAIMRWDWRDMFRIGNKEAISEMVKEYARQVAIEVRKECSETSELDGFFYEDEVRDSILNVDIEQFLI